LAVKGIDIDKLVYKADDLTFVITNGAVAYPATGTSAQTIRIKNIDTSAVPTNATPTALISNAANIGIGSMTTGSTPVSFTTASGSKIYALDSSGSIVPNAWINAASTAVLIKAVTPVDGNSYAFTEGTYAIAGADLTLGGKLTMGSEAKLYAALAGATIANLDQSLWSQFVADSTTKASLKYNATQTFTGPIAVPAGLAVTMNSADTYTNVSSFNVAGDFNAGSDVFASLACNLTGNGTVTTTGNVDLGPDGTTAALASHLLAFPGTLSIGTTTITGDTTIANNVIFTATAAPSTKLTVTGTVRLAATTGIISLAKNTTLDASAGTIYLGDKVSDAVPASLVAKGITIANANVNNAIATLTGKNGGANNHGTIAVKTATSSELTRTIAFAANGYIADYTTGKEWTINAASAGNLSFTAADQKTITLGDGTIQSDETLVNKTTGLVTLASGMTLDIPATATTGATLTKAILDLTSNGTVNIAGGGKLVLTATTDTTDIDGGGAITTNNAQSTYVAGTLTGVAGGIPINGILTNIAGGSTTLTGANATGTITGSGSGTVIDAGDIFTGSGTAIVVNHN
jgi:hypothetical protein